MSKQTAIYLDHAAATPLDTEVLTAMQPYLTTEFYNPSATYLAAKQVHAKLEESRARVAKVLGARPREVIFTAGATEANNLAVQGVMRRFPDAKVLVSAIEHSSVLEPAKQFNHAVIPVTSTGHVDTEKLTELLTDDVVLVSIMYANNEIGTVQYMSTLSNLIARARDKRILQGNLLPLYLHSDAAQAPNLLGITAKGFGVKVGVDLMSLNGGKIYGPKQSGALFVATGVQLEPLIYGGGQEFGVRSGTENVAGCVGFGVALDKAANLRNSEEKRLRDLQQYFYSQLEQKTPSIQITNQGMGLYNIVHILVPGADNERLMMELDEKGIQCAVGSACSASSDEPSHVLKAIGLTDEQAQSSLRFSMGRATTKAEITKVVDTLVTLLA